MKIFKKLEDTFAAAAFAEAGEFDTAREMVKDNTRKKEQTAKSDDAAENNQGDMTQHPSRA